MSNEEGNSTTAEELAPTVVKTATCPSISRKSKLSYQVGIAADLEMYFRVVRNSGGGSFSRDWTSLRRVLELLAAAPPGAITSVALRELSSSSNNSSFALAILQSAYFSDRGRPFRADRGRGFKVIVDDHGRV